MPEPRRCGPYCRSPRPCFQPEHGQLAAPTPEELAATPSELTLTIDLDPATAERLKQDLLAALREPGPLLVLGEPVEFDEPKPRGWLARAIAWVLR